MRPPPDRGSPPAPSPGQAKRRALLLTRGRVPVVLDMKLILSVMPPAPMPGNRTRALWPVQSLPPFQTNSRRLPSNRWRVFRNRRALRLHLSEQCRPISRQCGLLHACDKKNGAQTEYCPCLPASAGQVPAPPEQPATVARWPVTVSAVKQHELGLMVRAGDCLRPAGRPVSLPAGSPPAPVGCHSAHGAAAVPAAAHAAGRSGSATVTYVLAGTLGWSRVWDGTGPGLWWCDSASMPVVPGSLFSRRCSRLLLAAWVRAVSPVRT